MPEQEPRRPSPNELSEMVFGRDLSNVISIPEMYEFVQDKVKQARNEHEADFWSNHLEQIVAASPDLRTRED